MRSPLLAAAILLATALRAVAEEAPDPGVASLRAEIGGFGWRVLVEARSVEVYRIEPTAAPAGTEETVQGYPVISRGQDQGEGFTGRLRQALIEVHAAPRGPAKMCAFSPGVALRFVSGEGRLDLLLCFECDDLRLSSTDPKAPEARTAMRAFDDVRAAMLGLAQEALPEDRALAGLAGWLRPPDAAMAEKTGNRLAKVLRAGTKVEVYRISPEKGDPRAAAELKIEGYPVISRGPDRGMVFSNRLAAALYGGKTTLSPAKACEFRPGVAIRVSGPEGEATLLICFSCDEIKAVASPSKADRRHESHVSYQKGRGAWLELAKSGLPDDAEIQALK